MARCVLQSQAAAITGLETNVMSWGQFWNYDYVPLVAAYKSLDTRHLTHLSVSRSIIAGMDCILPRECQR